ncbi:hypothetical protein IHQ75_04315 [Bifidobacterium dentium]|uniref:hypothetical protein n=1 Tax=Bifidobacterium dentium TaxID=1689 RepID=UPI0018C319D0|nr:hypothetical protein [Bifidobacterium dentium]
MNEQNVGLLVANSHLRFRYCESCKRGVLDDAEGGFVETYDAVLLDYETAAAEYSAGGVFVMLGQFKEHWPVHAYSVLKPEDKQAVYLRFHDCSQSDVAGHVNADALFSLSKLDGMNRPVIAKIPSSKRLGESLPAVEQLELFA